MLIFSRKERWLRLVVSMLFTMGGSAGILVLVLVMNGLTPPERPKRAEFKEMLAAERKKPPRQKKRREPERTHRPQKNVRNNAPSPVISTAISGLSFDLPGMDGFGMEEAVDRLIGQQAVEDLVMTAETVDVAPSPLHEGRLEYPARARQKNIEGFVVINLLIDANGAVERVTILEAAPMGVFEDVTLEWARGLRFSPAYYNGKPVRTWARRRIPFRLS